METQRKWKAANQDRVRELSRNWYHENLDHVRERRRLRYHRDPERHKEGVMRSRAKNPDKYRQLKQRWRETHREREREYALLRRLREGETGYTTAEQIEGRFAMFGFRCYMCGTQEGLQVEHVIPVARGGKHLPANLRPACGPCNSRKHVRPWREFV